MRNVTLGLLGLCIIAIATAACTPSAYMEARMAELEEDIEQQRKENEEMREDLAIAHETNRQLDAAIGRGGKREESEAKKEEPVPASSPAPHATPELPPAQAIQALWVPPPPPAMIPQIELFDRSVAGQLVEQAGYIDGFPTYMACDKKCPEFENETGQDLAVFVDSRRATIFGGHDVITIPTRVKRDGRWWPANISVIPRGATAKFRMLRDGKHTFTFVAYTGAGGGVQMPSLSSRPIVREFPYKYAKQDGFRKTITWGMLTRRVQGDQPY